MSYLPARPLNVQRSYVVTSYLWGAVLFAAGIAITAAYLVWQSGDAQRIQQDQQVWEHGVASEDGSVTGTSRSRYGIFKEYTLNVSYTDNVGGSHSDHFSFDTLFGGLDDHSQPVLRFDPQTPSHYAISWAIECTTARWASVGFMSSVGAGIGFLVMFLGWALVGRVRLAKRLARESEEVECQVLSATEQYANGRPTGNMIYMVSIPPLPHVAAESAGYREQALQPPPIVQAVVREVVFAKKKGTPFFTAHGPNGDRVLALVSRRNAKHFLVLRHDFHPFELTEEQKVAALAQSA